MSTVGGPPGASPPPLVVDASVLIKRPVAEVHCDAASIAPEGH